MMRMRIIIYAAFVLILCSLVVSSQDINASLQQYINQSQLALNVYLDESGRALITGYIGSQEVLNTLGFLKNSEYIYDNETNEFYCLTDKLTAKTADVWTFNFTIEGYIEDFNLAVYFPKNALISKIEYSSNLAYHLASENESLLLEVNGFEVEDPAITANYGQKLVPPPTIPSTPTAPEGNLGKLLPIIAIFSITILLIVILFLHRRKALQIEEERELAGLKPLEIAIEITPEMKKVMETLSENEKNVVDLLIKSGGKLTQAKIRYETQIPKSSLVGIISSLERKKIIEKTKYGKTNVIELSKWFLSKNKEI